jgi:hypothetical protein
MLGDEAAAKSALQKTLQLPQAFPQKEEAQQRLAILTLDAKRPTSQARATARSRRAVLADDGRISGVEFSDAK